MVRLFSFTSFNFSNNMLRKHPSPLAELFAHIFLELTKLYYLCQNLSSIYIRIYYSLGRKV